MLFDFLKSPFKNCQVACFYPYNNDICLNHKDAVNNDDNNNLSNSKKASWIT